MSKGSCLSQYESPNIVIVPTMSSCKPSSPKRRKVGNNIIVPIVNNDSSEREELKYEQEQRKPKSDTVMEDTGDGSSKSSNTSCASKYLQSIGRDKKSSIWNRKIPRKSSQNVSLEASQNLISDVSLKTTCISKTDTEKNYQNKTPTKIAIDSNILDNKCFTKNRRLTETRQHRSNDNFKETKQSKHESLKTVSEKNSSGCENNNKLNVLRFNNENDSNKIKTKVPKSDNHKQTLNLAPGEKKSEKDFRPKNLTKNSSVTSKKQDPKKLEKSNLRSVVVKNDHKQDKGNSNAKDNIRLKQIKSSTSRPASYVTSDYRDKCKNQEHSIAEETPDINIENKINLEKLITSKKAKCNIDSKTRGSHNKETTRSNEHLSKKKLETKSNEKSIKYPIKRIVPNTKNYRKIKLVINLLCNDAHPPQSSESSNMESNNINKTCTRSNVDLDFLNDINVDEIVESLYTCEKNTTNHISDRDLDKCHSKKTLEINANTSQSDASDLIKILKGEDDDDLLKMSIENAKTIKYINDSPIITHCNEHSEDYASKSDETKHYNNNLKLPIKIKEEILEILDASETVESFASSNIQDKNIITNVSPIQSVNSLCAIKNGESLEKQQTKFQDDPFVIENINFVETLCAEVEGNESKKDTVLSTEQTNEEQKNNALVNINSPPALDDVEIDTHKIDSKLLQTEITNTVVISTTENEKDNNAKIIHETGADEIAMSNSSTFTPISDDHKDNNSTNKNSKPQHDSTNVNQVETSSKDCQISTEHHEDKNDPKDVSFIKVNSDEHKSNNSINQKCFPPPENTNVNQINTSEKQTELSIVNIIEVEKGATSNKNCKINHSGDALEIKKIDKQNADSKENNTEGDKKEKQKEVSVNEIKSEKECQNNISDKHKVTSSITCKVGMEMNVGKVEDRLLKCTGTKYSITTIIHTGKYSNIFKCKHPNGKYYALKMLTNTKYYLGEEKSQMVNTLIEDIPKHNLFLIHLANTFNVAEKWCFLMEFYPKNLSQALAENGKPFFIEHIQDFARQLSMAVMVLRNNNMVHMDIKPKHILINHSNKMLKLCGFDNLCYINNMRVLPNVGTVNYRAPEVILGFKAGFKIDVWSTGLVLFEMATNRKLFPGTFNNDILYKQMCTLGGVPYNMIKYSRYGGVHFLGSKFMRRSGIKGQKINIISKFYNNNILRDSIYTAYFTHWAKVRTISQKNSDMRKLNLFMNLIQKMLTMHPDIRLPIEFVYANPFIYYANLSQER